MSLGPRECRFGYCKNELSLKHARSDAERWENVAKGLAASHVEKVAEVAALRSQLEAATRALAQIRGIHERYCASDEGSQEEVDALNEFDDVCCNEVSAALSPSPDTGKPPTPTPEDSH